jgi:hypothetical protein
LEKDGVLHPDNEVDIYCLQICFMHLIQKDLDSFRSAWNEHKLRTANNMSPKRVFIYGLTTHKLTVLVSRTNEIFKELQQVSRKLTPITSYELLRDNIIFPFQENWKHFVLVNVHVRCLRGLLEDWWLDRLAIIVNKNKNMVKNYKKGYY